MRARVKEGDGWTGGRQLNETKQAGRTHQRGHREIEKWERQMGRGDKRKCKRWRDG